MEARISQLEEELEDEQNNVEILGDRARKNGLQVSRWNLNLTQCYLRLVVTRRSKAVMSD